MILVEFRSIDLAWWCGVKLEVERKYLSYVLYTFMYTYIIRTQRGERKRKLKKKIKRTHHKILEVCVAFYVCVSYYICAGTKVAYLVS